MDEGKVFKLRGKTLVIIDWANVYGWFKKLKWEISPQKLYNYLKSYPEIYDIRFYFGVEKGNKKSEDFQKKIKQVGYNLISREIKWVPVDIKFTEFIKGEDGQVNKIGRYEKERKILQELKGLSEELDSLIKAGGFVRRKCDFDVEVSRDVLLNLDKVDGIILFSGDGDYAPLAAEVIKAGKQMILVFARGCKGKEYENFDKGLYQCSVKKLRKFIQK